jgi:hypothetical protein
VSARSTETVTPTVEDSGKVLSHPLVIEIRNDYESKLMQKDLELRRSGEGVEQISRLVGGRIATEGTQLVRANSTGGNVAMWIEQLGNGSPSKILRFLAEKSGLKFMRS